MARLKIKLRGKPVSDLPLAEDRQYVVGRKEDSDIVLQPEKGISREHFKLFAQNGVWSLEVTSRYGDVIVGGERVQNVQLEHGMNFSVPPYDFEFLMTSGDSPLASDSDSQEQNSEEPLDDKTIVGVAPSIPYIKVLGGDEEAKELFRLEGGDAWLAGRDPNCAVVIRDPKVSRKQFEIRKVNGQFYIIDLGSVNGTIVNGMPIGDQLTPIKSGDHISVLDNHLQFELRDPNFASRMELVKVANIVPLTETEPSQGEDYVGGTYLPPEVAEAPFPMEVMPQSGYGSPMPYQGQDQMPVGYMPQPQGPMEAAPPHGKFDFQKHRPKLIAAAVLILALAFVLSDNQDSNESKPKSAVAEKTNDPFQKLSPAEQTLVKQNYELAKNYYMTGKYELAYQEIQKVLEKVPKYEESEQIAKLSLESIKVLELKRRNEQMEAAKLKAEQDIQKQADICERQVNPDITVSFIEDCLAPVVALNPEHPRILAIRQQAEIYTAQREEKARQQASQQRLIEQLAAMYSQANKLEKNGKNLEAIAAYKKVMSSSLPDPRGYKGRARTDIERIRKTMGTKTASFKAEASKFYQAGNLKGAILSLRKASAVDPTDESIKEKIEVYMNELKKQMMVLYQEGVLEESFGNVEGGEARTGAKDKWKRILQLDVPDGEYYKKAYIKLKKYGAL